MALSKEIAQKIIEAVAECRNLKVYDRAISKAEDWMKAQNAVNFVLFSGFQ